MLKKIALFIYFFCFPLAVFASDKIKIVTTTSQIADLVSAVTGNSADVEALMGTGIDPHLYRLTRHDISTLLKADIIFYNGLHLEGKMDEIFHLLKKDGMDVFPISDALPQEFLISAGDCTGLAYDPHIWMDVSAWIMGVDYVMEKLINHRPKNAPLFKANAARYKESLNCLDAWIHKAVRTVPLQKRYLITSHDAFNYFGKAYHIEVVGIQGISTDSEAGLQAIENLVNLVIKKNIQTVFTEVSISGKSIKAVIEGARSKGHAVTIGGELFADSMGKAGSFEGTYKGMLQHNVTLFVKAVGHNVDYSCK